MADNPSDGVTWSLSLFLLLEGCSSSPAAVLAGFACTTAKSVIAERTKSADLSC